jgi:carboxyl-terminal processing protease
MPSEWTGRGDEVVRIVRDHFFDKNAAVAWANKHDGYAAGVQSDAGFAALTKSALAELKASHTNYYTEADPEYYGLRAIFAHALKGEPVEHDSIGADVTPNGFVRTVFAQRPADRAGLHRGDKLLKADGVDFRPVLSFRGRAERPVKLLVQRKADQPPTELVVVPRRINPKKEWLDAQTDGARLVERNGKTAAYVPMFCCAGEEYEKALAELLTTRLRNADALILDFRNGWGGCNPSLVNLFNSTPAVLTQILRDGEERQFDSQWRKPFYVLINGGSRSGKEIVALSIKKHRLGTLVGERTAGAVLGGRFFLLSDRSVLYLAVMDIRADGERLEGIGVEPHVHIADALPFADGADPQLEKAIELATK